MKTPRLGGRTARLSLKARVVASTLVVAFAPQVLVFIWSQVDRPTAGRLWTAVRDVAVATQQIVGDDEALTRLAQQHGVWLRIEGPGRNLMQITTILTNGSSSMPSTTRVAGIRRSATSARLNSN
jgi:hypothetical protein